ncbi:MAG: ABC transporter permease [Bryobacterales bacterium]|nr:ABC transporter permease [Bryobacterales bacterium]
MRPLRAFLMRLTGLFGKERQDRELAEEIESHLQLQIDDNLRAGMDPAEARRQATLRFDGVEAVKESYRERRGLPWLETAWQDLRYAVRVLAKDRGFTAVAVLTLALGIGANTAIFGLIDAVMLKSLPVQRPEELLQVRMGESSVFTNPIWEQVRDRQDVFSGVFTYGDDRFNLSPGGEARYVQGAWVSGEFFETLGVQPALGRPITRADDRRGCPATAVLSYDFWQSEYAGNPAVVGRSVSLEGQPFQIIGVAGRGFSGMAVGQPMNIYVPVCSEALVHGKESWLDGRSIWWLTVIGRPRPGVTPQQVTARLKVLAPEIFRATKPPNWRGEDVKEYEQRTFETKPVAGGISDLRGQYSNALLALMGVVGAVLLIACANVANLILARASVRQREIAIRLALGSGRGRLIRQLLTESLLLSLTGAALGVLLAQWGSHVLVRLLSTSRSAVSLDLHVDGRMLAFTAAIAVATALLFGLAPAWLATRVQPNAAMKSGGRGTAEGHTRFSFGKALVIAQVALSLALVACAGLMLGTFRKLATLDPGFRHEHVLLTGVDLRNAKYPEAQRRAVFDRILERLRALPGVRSASSSDITPISGMAWNGEITVEGFKAKNRRDSLAYFNQVSDKYFETMGTPILAGRDFEERDGPTAPRVAIVNETLARKFFGQASPLGRTFRMEQGPNLDPPVEIVGVVRDAKYGTLREVTKPTAYLANGQSTEPGWMSHNFELRSDSGATDVIPAVRAAVAEVNPNVVIQFKTLSLQVEESLTRERLLAVLSGLFGGLALLLAMIGLYGVMSYNVTRRHNEIGIRMALGAAQGTVRTMVLRDVAILVALGLSAGIGLSLAGGRLIESFLFGMKASDPSALTGAVVLLAVVAALAGYLPARRASRVDPMVALREE